VSLLKMREYFHAQIFRYDHDRDQKSDPDQSNLDLDERESLQDLHVRLLKMREHFHA
jgi:hypothetical protein